jgi:hypothetical protein
VDTLNVTKYGVRIDDSTSISRGSNRIIDVDIADYYEDGTNSFNEMDVFARKIVSPVGVPTLTIASGEITVTGSYHDLLNEGGAGTDDLDTINGGTDGMVLFLSTLSSSQDVVVKDGTGNIELAWTGGDVTLDVREKVLILQYKASLGVWREVR